MAFFNLKRLERQYLMLLVFILFDYGIVELQASHHVLMNLRSTNQPYRTGYHFQPLKNFINDPNGPMLYKGIYHLFYQYNPTGDGVSCCTRVWGHSTSTDLVNWTPQPLTLLPQLPSNNQSSWSGSTTILPGNKPIILFTGIDYKGYQVQNVAIPKNYLDPYLKEWILIPHNPVIYPTPQNQIDPSNFRDPTTAWILPDGLWRVVIGSTSNDRGLARLFLTKDFIHWTESNHYLYSEDNTGMWECPDFFPVYIKSDPNNVGADTSTIGPNVKHVLKVSMVKTQHDIYALGTYDIKNDTFIPDMGSTLNNTSLRYDYGKYYASKTFYDGAKKRRILLSWIMEASNLSDDEIKKQGWAGIHAIPRSIWLHPNGKQLMQWPVSEIEILRENPINFPIKEIKAGSLFKVSGITAAQGDVEISFNISNLDNAEKFESNWTDPQSLCNQYGPSVRDGLGPFGLLTLASKGLEEYTAVFFRIFKANNNPIVLMCSDQSRSSLNPTPEKIMYGTFLDMDLAQDDLSLRILIDHSVVESFGGKGKSVITARVYPTLATYKNAHLYVFNNGTRNVEINGLNAWSMNKARVA